MFKQYTLKFVVVIGILMISMSALAQNSAPTPSGNITAVDAVNIAFATVDTNAGLLQIDYDATNACWYLEFTDGMNVCLSDTTGEPVVRIISATPTPTVTNPTSQSNITPQPTQQPVVSVEDAIATALRIFPGSIVDSANLEEDDGVLVWDIELDDDVRSVDVNAITGNIISFGYERSDMDNRERNFNNTSSVNNTSSSGESSQSDQQEFSQPDEASQQGSSEQSQPEFSEPDEPAEVSENSN